MNEDNMLVNFTKEMIIRQIHLFGSPEKAEAIRGIKRNLTRESIRSSWGGASEVRSLMLEAMDGLGRLILAGYLQDLILVTLSHVRPKVGEGLRAWAVRSNISEPIGAILENMPFDIETKWQIISSVLFHEGYYLDPNTKCFRKEYSKG